MEYPTVTSLIPLDNRALPQSIKLYPNYPNPFNPQTEIKFELSSTVFVQMNVYDVRGRKIAQLVNQKLSAGLHKVTWSAENLASGVYFCRLAAGDKIVGQKMILLR